MSRYEIRVKGPTDLSRAYGRDYDLYEIWDTVLGKPVPFSRYRTRKEAEERIRRREAQ